MRDSKSTRQPTTAEMPSEPAPKSSGTRRLVNTRQAASYLGLQEKTLENDRFTGCLGVPFFKIGRMVRYDLNEIDRYVNERCCGRTAPAPNAKGTTR